MIVRIAVGALSASLLTMSAAEAKTKSASNCRQLVLFGFSAGGHVINPGIPYGTPFNHSVVALPRTCQPQR